MARRLYLGLDPTSSPKRSSGYALVDGGARLSEVGLAATDAELVGLAERWWPLLVAIDAPLSWPADLDDPACRGRRCEIELARQGIGVYRTTAKSIIPALVERGIGLAAAMRSSGHRVVEVYPYASKVRLFGRPIPKKTRVAGRRWLQEKLAPWLAGLPSTADRLLTHDELDAVVAAYTAYLFDHGRAEELGDPVEGVLCIPAGKLASLPGRRASVSIVRGSGRSAAR